MTMLCRAPGLGPGSQQGARSLPSHSLTTHRDPWTMQLAGHTAQRDIREEWSTLRSKETLTQATTWMTLEDAGRTLHRVRDASHGRTRTV